MTLDYKDVNDLDQIQNNVQEVSSTTNCLDSYR